MILGVPPRASETVDLPRSAHLVTPNWVPKVDQDLVSLTILMGRRNVVDALTLPGAECMGLGNDWTTRGRQWMFLNRLKNESGRHGCWLQVHCKFRATRKRVFDRYCGRSRFHGRDFNIPASYSGGWVTMHTFLWKMSKLYFKHTI